MKMVIIILLMLLKGMDQSRVVSMDEIHKDYITEEEIEVYSPQEGTEIGDLCYEFDVNRVYADGISDETINPVETGKITVINFWGTWCTPCVNELPHFEQIASEYEEEVTVIAVHTNMISETASEFIDQYYADSKIKFACDSENEEYYTLLGGQGTYPYTLILDECGIIRDIHKQAIEYEDLQESIDSIMYYYE